MRSIAPVLFTAACLCSPAVCQRLVASEGNTFYSIDPVTAQQTLLVSLPGIVGTRSGLAYDAATAELFFVTSASASLYRLNLATGAYTLIGTFGVPGSNMQGFEVHSGTGQLYGHSQHDDGLYAIDRTTGAATWIGSTGIGGFVNLAHDPVRNVMFAVSTNTDSLYTVNLTTGVASLVGPLGNSTSPQALAYSPATDVLYLLDNNTDRLLAVDPSTGHALPVGNLASGSWLSLAFLPGGSGSILRQAHGCGSASVFAHGATRVGGAVTVALDGTTGIPAIGFGLQLVGLPFCGCILGHDWAVAVVGDLVTLQIPAAAALQGTVVGMQGVDLFGAGGCADPAIVLTDTLVLTIG
jgi:hypothetical protein